MKKLLFISLCIGLTGCESIEKWSQLDSQPKTQASIKNEAKSNDDALEQSLVFDQYGTYLNSVSAAGFNNSPDIGKVYSNAANRNINHYIRGITHDLIENLTYVNEQTPIGIASFVLIDGTLDSAGVLGKQIAESFQHEIYKFGIPVIDFKTTDFFRVTPEGDFILSRDYLELKPNLPIEYVLLGTLVKHDAGYLVNARIVGLDSKAIVASAQGFLPQSIADSLLGSQKVASIRLE